MSRGGEIRCGGIPDILGKNNLDLCACVCVYSLPKGQFTFVALVKLIEKSLCGFSAILPTYSWVKSSSAQTLSLSNYQSHDAIYQILVAFSLLMVLLHCDVLVRNNRNAIKIFAPFPSTWC